ncbi:unnamed protein product, partial [Pleuronectes platessa]
MRALHSFPVGAFLTLLLCLPSPGHGESYFGASHCSLQVIQDVSTFQLSMHIKTSRRSGLLLLAAGMEDYLFVELQNGKIQARMNSGSGEVPLSSSQGVQLNNLLDHKIALTLQDGKLTMIIDDLYPTYVPVNDDGELLNIDMGLWLGGTGDLDAPYLTNAIPPFRGCMTEVKFESHQFDILSTAFKQCHDTKESCSSEFEAGDGEATSFSTPDSFVSFPTWSGATGAPRVLEFLMKTTIEDALLVFHPGRDSDFIAISVMKGYLKGVLDLGSGMKVLENTEVQLDDDQWHRVKVQISQDFFVINVDSQPSSLPLDSSEQLDLAGNLYLGGIQGKMKEVFRESGSLNRAEEEMTVESFIGCLGEIKVNQKDRSLQDALVTKDVHVKCEGDDYDYSSYYDVDATTTPPVRIRYVDMDETEQHCYPTDETPEIFRNVTKLLDVTPLLVPEGSNSSIGIETLAVIAHPRNGDIMYNITQPLLFGELHIMTSDGLYKQVTAFRQSDLDQNRIRYVSTDSSDQEDIVVERIQFDTHLGQFSLWNNTFLVKIMPAQVKVSVLVPLEMEAGEEQTIGLTELQAEVKEKNPDPQTVKYILVKPPTLGSLLMSDKELAEGDMFTQKDIMDNTISYRVRVQRAADSIDQFQFRVLVEDQYSPLYTFPINILANADAPVLTNEMLVVLQGAEETLNKNYLWMQSQTSTDFVYRVLQGPKNGRLIRDSPEDQPRFEGAIRVFSNEDLKLDRLIYKHDGSRTSSDEFHFSAFDQGAENSENQEAVSGVFRLSIQTKNEHVPVRVVDKVLNVVRYGQHLLTTDVIQFKDEDSGFNDTQIVYAREGILSGNIVSASNPSQPLFRFTQADLRDKKILFIHRGADRERFSLQVSDGYHKTTALLEIEAGEAYLRVVNNAIIVIDHGSTKTLNTSLLSADTNVDIRDDSEMKFQITSPPSDGKIIVSGIEASTFSQEDLKKGVVSYEHNYESRRSKDSFSFRVQAHGHSEDGTFRIKIFKQGYRSEPEVITNEVIISYEGEHTIINPDHLK